MGTVVTPVIGASVKQVWKPTGVAGAASDGQAPFELGTTVTAVGPRNVGQFCRCAQAIAIGATAGITNGVTIAAIATNTWTNDTGVALAIGDYVFLFAADGTTP